MASHPVRDHCLAPGREAEAALGAGGYGRMFPDLPPLRDGEDFFRARGREAVEGRPSPFVDRDPAGATTDAEGAAGWPVFAQFLAHDLTADRSALASRADVGSLRNARVARLDLECVYGLGPAGQPYLVERDDPARMLLGRNDAGAAADLPRNGEGVALVGDPRNDVHLPISQLHVAFLRAHNRLVDRLREDGVGDEAVFAEAQRALRWHLQWIVLHDYLPRLVGDALAAQVRDAGPRWFAPGDPPALPVEFADGAFRYGHSQVRNRYRLRPGGEPLALFPDLIGFRPVPADRVIDWSQLFDLPGRPPAPQRAKAIDGRLVAALIKLPAQITGAVDQAEFRSLAVRDLQRGLATGLPSGEAVARTLGVEPLTAAEIGVAGWKWETPLWFYVLKEAELRGGGERLGPVGGTIVAEVLVGIVDHDPTSYRAVDADWCPTLAGPGGAFGLGDLLVLAAG